MATWTILGTRTGTVTDGNAGSNNSPSSFIRPSTIGAMRYLKCNYGVVVAVANDLSTFVSINGSVDSSKGSIHEDNLPNDYDYFGWPHAFLCASLKELSFRAVLDTSDDFVLKTPDGSRTYSYNDPSNWDSWLTESGAKVFYHNFGIGCPKGGGPAISRIGWSNASSDPSGYGTTFPNATSLSNYSFEGTFSQFVSDMKSKGYFYVGKLGDTEWGTGEASRTGYVYFGGMCLFNSSQAQDTAYWTNAAKVPITALRDFMDYYPWERRIGNNWESLNRDGGPSVQQATGLFRRDNTKWNPVSNTEANDATKQHGFRYNNGWQKSPKSGQGA